MHERYEWVTNLCCCRNVCVCLCVCELSHWHIWINHSTDNESQVTARMNDAPTFAAAASNIHTRVCLCVRESSHWHIWTNHSTHNDKWVTARMNESRTFAAVATCEANELKVESAPPPYHLCVENTHVNHLEIATGVYSHTHTHTVSSLSLPFIRSYLLPLPPLSY